LGVIFAVGGQLNGEFPLVLKDKTALWENLLPYVHEIFIYHGCESFTVGLVEL
jgi:hypothetical protein